MWKGKRKGFTLVELLIVIIILGALSATMMLSSGDSVAAAKAQTIVANLVTIKDAALVYYSTNIDDSPTVVKFQANAQEYLGDTAKTSGTVDNSLGNLIMEIDSIQFGIQEVNNPKNWLATCNFSKLQTSEKDAIRDKLIELTSDAKLVSPNDHKKEFDGTGNLKHAVRLRIR